MVEFIGKVSQVCEDIQELYEIYSHNWFDVEGNPVAIDSVILKFVKNAENLSAEGEVVADLYLFFTFQDFTEDTIYQQVGSNLTLAEIKVICDYCREEIDCNISAFSVQ